ncbi:MAG: hypothetical protein WAV10_03660 [Minisyncoccia bacterium]
MSRYIINQNAQPTGENEIHNDEKGVCDHLPNPENRILIGYYSTCQEAIIAARTMWPKNIIDGCAYCCPACNTR